MRENFSLSCRKKKTQEKNDSAVEGKDCRFWVKKNTQVLAGKAFLWLSLRSIRYPSAAFFVTPTDSKCIIN